MKTRLSLDESGICEEEREADNRANGEKAGEREASVSQVTGVIGSCHQAWFPLKF